ncbi:MAG: TPM domain-containing protein [Bacillota bacterium]
MIALAKNAVVSAFAMAKGRAARQALFTWLTLLAVLLPVLPLAAAPAIPSPAAKHFYVLDEAGVLSDAAEYKIQALSSQLAAKTNAQVVAVTVRSLQGEPIEDYALAILRQWGIGGKQENNGLLMLVVVDDRRSRIEVGYGLEGVLPDAKTGRIQDEFMLPFFKNGEYEQGILNGYTAIVEEVAKEYNVTLNAPPAMSQKRAPAQNNSWDTLPWWGKLLLGLGVGSLIIVDILFFGGRFTWLLLSIFFRGGRGGGGSGGGGSGGGGGSNRNW